MLSDRVCAFLALCDSAFKLQYLSTWPRSEATFIKKGLESLDAFPADQQSSDCNILPGSRLYRFSIPADHRAGPELLVLKEGVQSDNATLAQLADVVRLGINIWGHTHSEVASHELIRAILQDDPMKMRQLSNIFRIDVANINEM